MESRSAIGSYLADIHRRYKIPSKSFFLFGSRGVGKSTWIRQWGKNDLAIDLLRHSALLELQRDPTLLEATPFSSGHDENMALRHADLRLQAVQKWSRLVWMDQK
jgi:hypothetical protein